MDELLLENRVQELEKLHWPRGKDLHDHPDIGVRDGRLSGAVHPTAWIGPDVKVGENVKVGPHCVIGWEGFGYTTDDQGVHHRRRHPCGVRIGDNVEIGAGTVIDRGRYRHTVIGSGTKIDANVFIAHNCLIGENCLIIANSQISGSCVIGDRCHIGPAATLTDHIKVGDGGRCGLGAVVIRDVPAGVTVVGNPARPLKPSVKATGAVLTPSEVEGWEKLATAPPPGPESEIERGWPSRRKVDVTQFGPEFLASKRAKGWLAGRKSSTLR